MKLTLPMSETAYYILLALVSPKHGYGIIKYVEEITSSRIILGSGTVYGTLKKMQKDSLIDVYLDEERKTVYKITNLGKEVLTNEISRIKLLYTDALKVEKELNKGEN